MSSNPSETKPHDPVVPVDIIWPFALVTTLFALWGFANDVTNPLVRAFKEIFLISNAQSSLVQTAFYGGYATMALPAAIFIRRFSYKSGILVGLALYATGALMFIPASMTEQFPVFLAALYVLTWGLAFLETTANPYILAMGPKSTATRRLNFAQAFNPIGSLVGMIVASQVVLASLGVQEFRDLQTKSIQKTHKAEYEKNLGEYESDPTGYKAALEQQRVGLEAQKSKLTELEDALKAEKKALRGLAKDSAEYEDADEAYKQHSEEFEKASGDYKQNIEAYKDKQMPVDGKYRPMLPGRIDGEVGAKLKSYKEGDIDFAPENNQDNKKYADHRAMVTHDLSVIRLPYVTIGLVIIGMFLIFAVSKLPKAGGDDPQVHFLETLRRLFTNWRYLGGVIAQTFYVGAQIMCWTYIIHFAMSNLNMSLSDAQLCNIGAMGIFCGARFICTYLLKFVSPGGLLMCLALGGMLFTLGVIFNPNIVGLVCLIAISACMSLMFPTIYGIALDGMGEDAKLGSAGLIFAIVGGALMPYAQGYIIDQGDEITGQVGFMDLPAVNASFVLPLICFVVIAIYGFLTHNHHRNQPEAA